MHSDRTTEPPTDRTTGRLAPWWVKLLVLFHVACITAWACPRPKDTVLNGKEHPIGSDWILFWNEKYLKANPQLMEDQKWPGAPPKWWVECVSYPIQLYLFSTGTWQYWDMFSPNPAATDWWGDAEITYQDGSRSVYQYPRMFLLSIPQKFVKERFRKFYERAHSDDYQWLFPQFGLRIALINFKDPKNPPIRVALRRHWLEVMPPGTAQPTAYNAYNYFTYEVDQRMLRKLAGGKGS